MQYFLDTTETIPSGVGWAHFDTTHFAWLAVAALTIVLNCLLYRRLDEKGKDRWKKTVALLIVADEIFKMVMLTIGGRYEVDYLPLHLCSVNIFLIAIHAWRPSVTLDNFLYTVGIPGALAAMLFPIWTELPLGNFMHIHSFTVHILLVAYPVMLLFGGDLRLGVRYAPRCIALLAGLAVIALGVNLVLDTNFMFLMEAEPGNPLYAFEQLWGDHRLGFAVLIPAILAVMYAPLELARKIRK